MQKTVNSSTSRDWFFCQRRGWIVMRSNCPRLWGSIYRWTKILKCPNSVLVRCSGRTSHQHLLFFCLTSDNMEIKIKSCSSSIITYLSHFELWICNSRPSLPWSVCLLCCCKAHIRQNIVTLYCSGRAFTQPQLGVLWALKDVWEKRTSHKHDCVLTVQLLPYCSEPT